MPVKNDVDGADFVAYRIGEKPLAIQLKGRPEIRKAYRDNEIWMAFPTTDPDSHVMYMVPHDELMEIWRKGNPNAFTSSSWLDKGIYNGRSQWLYDALREYELG